MRRTDDHDVADSLRDQLDATQDECAHQDLAELVVSLYQGDERVAFDFDPLARLTHAGTEQRPPPRDHVGFTGETPRRVHGDQRLARPIRAYDLQLARLHHEERDDVIAG